MPRVFPFKSWTDWTVGWVSSEDPRVFIVTPSRTIGMPCNCAVVTPVSEPMRNCTLLPIKAGTARAPPLTRIGSTSKPYLRQMPLSAVTHDGVEPGAMAG